MTGRTRLWNERFFNIIQLNRITRISRAAATGGAMQFLKRHAHNPNSKSQRFLDELNLTKEDVVLGENGEVRVLTQAEITALHEENTDAARAEVARDLRVRGAIRRFVDESILRPNAATRPIWASDPHFQIPFHLKSFMYTFHEVILKRVYREAVNKNFVPLVSLMAFIPVMMFADLMRDFAKNGGEEDPRKAGWTFMDHALESAQRAGLPGLGMLVLDAQQDRQFGGLGIESFLGPLAGSLRDVDDLVLGPDRWDAIVDQLPAQNTVLVNATLR
jgi:hypothetical protein